MAFENCTVESFAFFLLNCNWNHGNLLSLILLIAKIYSAKFAVFGLVNRQNLFQKNFHWPKFLPLRYWCLLIFGCWWLLEFLTNLITWWTTKNFLFPTFTAEFGWACPFFGLVCVGVTFTWLGVDGCRSVWPFLGRVQVTVNFLWLGLGECGWVWVRAQFITAPHFLTF